MPFGLPGVWRSGSLPNLTNETRQLVLDRDRRVVSYDGGTLASSRMLGRKLLDRVVSIVKCKDHLPLCQPEIFV